MIKKLLTLASMCALVLATLVAGSSVPAAAATSTTHPYSNPVWWPVHAKVYVDCVLSNPGCKGAHQHWTMDVVRETVPAGAASGDSGVYAMGAGQLHVGDAHGRGCRAGAPSTFGTWVWVDHGGGVISRYGHLANIAVRNGGFVAAGQRIGTMGVTGKGSNCSVPYLDFQVRHRGVTGPFVQIKTLKACYAQDGRSVQTWPTALNATAHWRSTHPVYSRPSAARHYAVWNDVPQRSVDFPATTSGCIPRTIPNTPTRPTHVSLTRAGSHRLTVRWAHAPRPATSVQIRLSVYHPSVHRWDVEQKERFVAVGASHVSYRFRGLADKRLYRVKVSFNSPAGFSRPSAWYQRTAGA